jgi:hypothetical protein
MARPKTGQTPPISFRPPQQLLKDFDATVEEGRSRSDVLIELMHERVAKKPRVRPVSSKETEPLAEPRLVPAVEALEKLRAALPERPAGSEETSA